ncbi:phosphatidylserine decarboxylase [Roseospirillum parvum]|uniref:Phosphatidylserine decarboxylase proenzyme n=1 Tax=Roseospirillum parvum TaxID=83401 RepID=A0A1G8FIF2_9PROT|nr:phosphatidylserine decarboxylase [Roseospirillum parvum]SDH81789.1 phosphatidylserine decarboxylase [Roseospirillum parvum]
MQILETNWRTYLLPKLDPEAPRFVAIAFGVALVLWAIWTPLGALGLVAALGTVGFFRDPDRVVPTKEGLVVAPASGTVSSIGPATPPAELEMGKGEMLRVSIFLSVLDCHVCRIPIAGTVTRVAYSAGKFLNATLDKASEDNERNAVRLKMADGKDIAVVQIAGWVARRIRCDVGEGQGVQTGQRFGLIRFGSRVDVYLPKGTNPLVVVGQSMTSGETVLADLKGKEAARSGETR